MQIIAGSSAASTSSITIVMDLGFLIEMLLYCINLKIIQINLEVKCLTS